ncbi:MAG TPA: hypothetical protein VFY45_09250 [Baekduia sp.]|nr:hypothetical protein [Baekduia sp.]
MDTIRLLVNAGVPVICSGGGGIPVTVSAGGRVAGVEAVVDKDLSAALLARRINADMLLLLTDVEELELAAGSMGPKVQAAGRFAAATGGRAAIGALGDAAALVAGTAGTQVKALARAF